jgi:hypothetical protein
VSRDRNHALVPTTDVQCWAVGVLPAGELVTVTRYARLVVTQTDLLVRDGRTLHAYDALADGVDARLAVFWHHGTPNLGAPPEPLLPAADVASVADALGIEQFAVMGHSGGAAHALACAALLPQRVLSA